MEDEAQDKKMNPDKKMKKKALNRGGEAGALFEELLSPRYSFYRKWAISHLGPSEGDDAFQDALEKAWKNFPRLRDIRKFHSWFFKILNNSIVDRVRKKYPSTTLDCLDGCEHLQDGALKSGVRNCVPGVPSPQAVLEDSVLKKKLLEAMLSLDSSSRFIVFLFYGEEMGIEEIAGVLGKKNSWVKVRLFRARRKLFNVLKNNTAS